MKESKIENTKKAYANVVCAYQDLNKQDIYPVVQLKLLEVIRYMEEVYDFIEPKNLEEDKTYEL